MEEVKKEPTVTNEESNPTTTTSETTQTVETQVDAEPKKTVEEKPLTKNDILRELSKEHGVNLFDVEGLKQFKEYTDSQKSEQQKLQEKLEALNNEREQWQSKQLEYEAKLKASELGIRSDALEDALKLANNDPNNLAEVIEKYPVFKNTKDVRIGVQNPNGFQKPKGDGEAEQYMAQNPIYDYYNKTKK